MNNSESFSNLIKDDLTFATWPYPYPYTSVPQSAYQDWVSDGYRYPSTAGSYVPDFNTADDAANLNDPDPWFTYALSVDVDSADSQSQLVGVAPLAADSVATTPDNDPDPWFTYALSVDVDSADFQSQLVGVVPLAADSVATTPDSGVSPTPTTPTSQDEWASFSDFLQTPCTTPASSPGHGGEVGWPAPEHGASLFEATTSRMGRDPSELSWPVPVASGHVALDATATYAPTTALGKRRLEAEEPQGNGGLVGINIHDGPPQKRARGRTSGILEAKGTTARTHHNLVARIPEKGINGKPKAAGRGAERLATPSAHGFYHQSPLGPSFQQGWSVEPAHGKPSWVEGSVDGKAEHSIDSAMRQQQQEATRLFKIPRTLDPMYRMLLRASLDDLARDAVQTIKCRLCPGTDLENFDQFKRHCRTAEAHPLEILFCDRCGDFFARCDSLKRHNSQPPAECRKVTLEEAAEKCRVTKEEHKRFVRHLKHSLTTGGVIGRTFSEIIKEKYPGSSKKRK